ncbi:MAG: multicopper oxidase domain-containing protein [Chloroflexi bacterium]|nr:multicopper oxidase domain-containing protein [Chloroflexota bacterium]
MNRSSTWGHLTRRNFLKLGTSLTLAAVGTHLIPRWADPSQTLIEAANPQVNIHLAATDGFIYLPGTVPTFHPDPLAPAPFTNWGFGFRNVTGLTAQQVQDQRNKFQTSAPMLAVDELDDVRITLTNLGLAVRPDLTDGHTIHFHGFRNAIPLFDGVPELSIAVPTGRDFTYFYHPRDPGTYMYHCHFEDVEHVSMGMTGIIFVRPAQNKTGASGGPVARLGGNASSPVLGYVYNDGVAPSSPYSTAYDREYGMFLSEVWAEERYRGAHIQEHDWSEYNPDIWLLNGRSYPDTLAPNGGGTDTMTGDLIPPPGRPELQYQPLSSLVECNSNDRVLLRFVNLGYQQHAMRLDGIPMKIVGKDATLLRGRDGTFNYQMTDTIYVGPGESVDALFVAPVVSTQTTFLLYNRNYNYLHNPGIPGLGGQMTEIRVSPSGIAPQRINRTMQVR